MIKVNFITWLIAAYAATVALIIICSLFIHPPIDQQVPWDEAPKDGWTFVGRTERGTAIRKKYFKEHGVWIFVTATGPESMSAVPLEVLQRTQAGEQYK